MSLGDVSVRVVPDATDFWRRFEARTRGSRPDVDVRVRADTARARAEIAALGATADKSLGKSAKQSNLLRDAILALGPAAVPVGAVLGGALLGLLPTLAATGLGIKGISKELKSGQLDGTQYGRDIASVRAEVSTLQQVAAKGLLPGVDAAIRSSRPLFKQLNVEVAGTATQVGAIASHAAPALLNVLQQLNPLFSTFGAELGRGAAKLEHWVATSDGVRNFVAYVQTELPAVEHTLGALVGAAGHLVTSFAPLGSVTVGALGLLAGAISALPTSVLTGLEAAALSTYAAFRVYGGVTALVTAVGTAFTALSASYGQATLGLQASALAAQAAAAEEAAGVAAAKAVEAQAVADAAAAMIVSGAEVESLFANQAAAAAGSAASMAESFAGINSLFATEAEVATQTTAVVAAELQAQAAAAAAAAAEMADASVLANAGLASSGGGAVGAGAKFAKLLGPLAAVGVGVGLLTLLFANNSDQARDNQKIMDAYASSLQKSSDALSAVNINTTIKNLTDAKAGDLIKSLGSENDALGLSLGKLAFAVNGPQQNFDRLYASLIRVRDANIDIHSGRASQNQMQYTAQGKAAQELAAKLLQLHGVLIGQEKAQRDYAAAQQAALILASGGVDAVNRQAGSLNLSRDAYLSALTAAKKNTEQTRAQTAAFQLENAAGSLLQQTLDRLNGKTQSYADTQNAFQQSLVSLRQSMKGTDGSIKGMSATSVALRGNILDLIHKAEAEGKAFGDLRGHGEAARQKMIQLRQTIIDQAVAHGANRKAVTAFVEALLKIPKHGPPTPLDADTTQARAKIAALKLNIANIRQNRVPHLNADTLLARERIAELQRRIDALNGKTITITTQNVIRGHPTPSATGTIVHGPGTGTSDTAGLFALSDWEAVIPAVAVKRHRRLIEALIAEGRGGARVKGMAAGGYVLDGHRYADLKAAKAAATAAIRANVALSITIEHQGFRDWKQALAGTVAQARAAFGTILHDSRKLGISDHLVKSLTAANGRLDALVGRRNKVRDALGTPASTATTAYERLAAAMGNAAQEAASVRAAVNAAFDITTAGASPVTGQITGAGIAAQDKQAVNRVKRFYADIVKLGEMNLNGTYVAQLAEKGPDALAEAEAVLTLGRRGIGGLNRDRTTIDSYASKLGKYVGQQRYGASVTNAQADVNRLRDRLHTDNQRIEHRLLVLERALGHAADRIVARREYIMLNGKVIATVVNEENRKAARR